MTPRHNALSRLTFFSSLLGRKTQHSHENLVLTINHLRDRLEKISHDSSFVS